MFGKQTVNFFLSSLVLSLLDGSILLSALIVGQNQTSAFSNVRDYSNENLGSSMDDTWIKVNNGPFSAREGLMAVSTGKYMFLSGGRDGYGVKFSSEIWRSEDDGEHWIKAAEGFFPGRAYHAHVTLGNCMYIMGGQDLSTFYNDVWKSCDGLGEEWTCVTNSAPWPKRAGIAFTTMKRQQETDSNEDQEEIVIAGGCYNKDDDPMQRSFLGDVWSSADGGLTWTEITSQASWKARSGARLVTLSVENDKILLLVAGEVGFTDDTQLGDIWKSLDGGKNWDLVTEQPGFSPRSGHGVLVIPETNEILVIAGWPHLHDVYSSMNGGENFVQVSNTAWNCKEEACGKFDFWPLIHSNQLYTVGGSGAYSTFGKLWKDTWKHKLTF